MLPANTDSPPYFLTPSRLLSESLPFFDEPTPDIERGVIAHAVLENFDFTSEDDVFVQVGSMVDKGVFTKEQIEKIYKKVLGWDC